MKKYLWLLLLLACNHNGGIPDPPKPLDSSECSAVGTHLRALGCGEYEARCHKVLGKGLRLDTGCLRSVRSCEEMARCK